MSLAAAVLIAFLPDVSRTRRALRADRGEAHPAVVSVLRRHRRTLLTLGTGVLVISAARATRQTIVPLWAASPGPSPSTVSLVYGVSAGVDMQFYPGGAIMDRYGRVFVAVPSMLVLGLGFLLLPLTASTPAIAAVAGLMGLGNDISPGVVMTLGADVALVESRAQFPGGWRLCADAGNAAGPLVVNAVSAVAPAGRRRRDHGPADLGRRRVARSVDPPGGGGESLEWRR